MSEHWIERLSAHIDGDLSPEERVACDAHLLACAECRLVLEDLRRVIALAREDADRAPATDLWSGIAARLQPAALGRATGAVVPMPAAREARQPAPPPAVASRRRISLSLTELALAASLLIAVSAGTAYLAARRPALPSVASQPMVFAQGEQSAPSSGAIRPANFADAAFDAAVADLEHILSSERDSLDPRTVRVIERNLQAIDEAIRQSRTALDADPANPFLNSHLADARQRKLALLRRAALLTTSGGD